MVIIGTKLIILEISVSCLLFFLTFISIYNINLLSKFKKIVLLPSLFVLTLFISLFMNTFSNFLLIVIMYIFLKEHKKSDYYLLNSIILSLLIEFISSTISSVIASKIYGTNELLWVEILLLSETILILLITFGLIKIGMKDKIRNFQSPSLSIILLYNYAVLLSLMFFIRKFEAYIPLEAGILIFLLVQGIAIIFIFIYEQNRQKESFEKKLMAEQLNNLKEYTTRLDIDQKEMHKFKHDYINIINSLNEIAVSDDNNDLKKSLRDLEVYSAKYFSNISMDNFKDLEYVSNPYIKSLLISKLKLMKSNNIDCYFECKSNIETVNINIFDLIRLLGVSIDNAIESVNEQKNGKIQIILIETDNQLEITIKNTVNKIPSVSQFKEYGFSTKKDHSGIGMVNVQDIKKKYRNLLVYYNTINNWFCIQMVITNQGDKK